MKDLNKRIQELLEESEIKENIRRILENTNTEKKPNADDETKSDAESENPVFGADDDSASDENNKEENTDNQDTSSDSDNGEPQSDGDSGNSENDEKSDNYETDKETDDEKKEDDDFSANDMNDFLTKTNTNMTVTRVSSEPSPIFGPNDTKNHNKYKITLSNKNGTVWFYFWDSLSNTNKNMDPNKSDILVCFGSDIGLVNGGVSMEEFKSETGYNNSDDDIAQRAYDGCRKMLTRAQKLFDEKQINELIRLSNEL